MTASGFNTERAQRLDQYLHRQVARGRLPGLSALIAHRGELIYRTTIGYADLQHERPIEADAIFRIFSLSKVVTSVAVLMLYERGKFLLRDPVADYLPAFKNVRVFGCEAGSSARPGEAIKIIDLLKHTSGLCYGNDEDHAVDRLYREAEILDSREDLADFVVKLTQLPLKYQPGSHWEYGVSHDVLGRLIEVVSGQALDEFLRTQLFEPLDMLDTGFTVPEHKQSRFLKLFQRSSQGVITEDRSSDALSFTEPLTLLAGGQGLVSTVPDYYRFLLMLRNGGNYQGRRCLSRKTVALMTRNHLPPNLQSDLWMSGYGYGLGVAVLTDLAAYQHLGSEGEFTWSGSGCTWFWVDPAEDIIALLFTQVVPQSACNFPLYFKSLMYQALE